MLHVLVAEDTPANQKIILYILEKRGHIVATVENGRQAVDLVSRERFDVVLMDLQMPVMDGFEATAAIRRLNDATKARIPTIAVTAHSRTGDQDRCLTAGMDAYISKPIKRDELIETVERLGADGAALTNSPPTSRRSQENP